MKYPLRAGFEYFASYSRSAVSEIAILPPGRLLVIESVSDAPNAGHGGSGEWRDALRLDWAVGGRA
jgi:hypothetical protein